MPRQRFSTHIYATGFHGKFCSKCRELKWVSEFYPVNNRYEGELAPRCKQCAISDSSERLRNPRTRPGILKTMNSCRLKRAYGISVEDRNKIISSQNGKCLICSVDLSKPAIDHCHKTGRVRGVLCVNCNTGIGMFGDSVEKLKSAIEYLEKFSG